MYVRTEFGRLFHYVYHSEGECEVAGVITGFFLLVSLNAHTILIWLSWFCLSGSNDDTVGLYF